MFALTLSLLVVMVTMLLVLMARWQKSRPGEPPSPYFRLPILGHLHLMAGYAVPFEAFTQLSKKFGAVFTLQLGQVKCVVVNGQKNVREALVTKGHHFDSRPNFQRYQQLFSGNKENSLAFCDWSATQKTRRDMLKAYTFPRAFTHKYNSLELLIEEGVDSLVTSLSDDARNANPVALKERVLHTCAAIFTRHFCSTDFDTSNDEQFSRFVDNFDSVFYEVNQGYAADFLPFLMPFHRGNMSKMSKITHEIRQFILDRIVRDRMETIDLDDEPADYLDSLIGHVKRGESPELTWESALFALEDIVGGHSAVGNFLIKLLTYLARNSNVQTKIQEEIETNLPKGTKVTISHRTKLPYTEGAIFEAIRLIASPIVPRVANRDSSINGYEISKGTVIFLNNHELSMSDSLWESPEQFRPERFVKDGHLYKPDFFLPFGGGRRSCMGYKMVQLLSFGIVAGLLQHYNIVGVDRADSVPVGSLALPKETFRFTFEARV